MFLDKIIVAFLTYTIFPSFILLSYNRSVIFPPPLRGFMFPPRKFSSGFSILPPSVSASLRVELLEEVERSRSCQQSRRKRSERKTKVEWPLHWWNLIHLIDSKWSSSDLARHDRFLNGIKTSCWGAQVVESTFRNCVYEWKILTNL